MSEAFYWFNCPICGCELYRDYEYNDDDPDEGGWYLVHHRNNYEFLGGPCPMTELETAPVFCKGANEDMWEDAVKESVIGKHVLSLEAQVEQLRERLDRAQRRVSDLERRAP